MQEVMRGERQHLLLFFVVIRSTLVSIELILCDAAEVLPRGLAVA